MKKFILGTLLYLSFIIIFALIMLYDKELYHFIMCCLGWMAIAEFTDYLIK